MTTVAASMGVNKLPSLFGIFGEDHDGRTQIELNKGFMICDTPDVKADCICRKRRGIADRRRIVLYSR